MPKGRKVVKLYIFQSNLQRQHPAPGTNRNVRWYRLHLQRVQTTSDCDGLRMWATMYLDVGSQDDRPTRQFHVLPVSRHRPACPKLISRCASRSQRHCSSCSFVDRPAGREVGSRKRIDSVSVLSYLVISSLHTYSALFPHPRGITVY